MRQHAHQRMGAIVAMILAVVGAGCPRDEAQVKWAANGVEVTRLELPLDPTHTFMVGEYALEGREGSTPDARTFRDRVLLTTQLRGREGQVLGFATRTYADGTTSAYGLSGTLRPVRPVGRTEPAVMVVAALAHPVASVGLVDYRPTAWVQLRLDLRTGRISAEAP